jgi:phosphoribosylglycinamide formyltransferase 1
MPAACDIVVLISGNGNNLQALIDCNLDRSKTANCPYRIAAVFSNQAAAYGLKRAALAGIPNHCLQHDEFENRAAFDRALQQAIDRYQPQLIVLAGFMRILTPEFVRHYQGRMLNIHPSLLPLYRGLDTHRRVIEAGDTQHGASVHFVTEELDGGPVVLQSQISVLPGDTPESLAQRVHAQEHLIYPLVVTWYAEGRLRMLRNGISFDGRPVTTPLIYQELNREQLSGMA